MSTATSTAPHLAQVLAQPSQPNQEGSFGQRALDSFLNLATIGGALWLDRELGSEARNLPDRQDTMQHSGQPLTTQVEPHGGGMIIVIGLAIAAGAFFFGNR